jgi:hypothetical protein
VVKSIRTRILTVALAAAASLAWTEAAAAAAAECSPIAFATTSVAGTILAPDETDCWRFDANARDRVRIRVTKTGGGAFNPRIELLRPTGTTLCGPTGFAELTCTLDLTGTHTILIRDAAGTNPGDYRIAIERVSASAPHEADLGSLDLTGSAHELPLAVSGGDGYGVEIDHVTLTLESSPGASAQAVRLTSQQVL